MHNLYPKWGQGELSQITQGGCVATVVMQGKPDAYWPPIGALIQCNDNRFDSEEGQLWWISFDHGIYFLEEMIE